VALVLALTVAGFILARANAERDARENSKHRVEVAAAQIRTRVAVATSLTESLRRFMLDEGATGVTNDEFTRNALRWLSPADLPAAAWAEEIRAADRTAYERRIGSPIVTPDGRGTAAPPASSYLPATLVSGFPPMNSRGVDLRREMGIAAAFGRATIPGGVGATPVAARRDGTRGLFLIAPAPNLIDGVLRPGAVAVFLSESTLRAAARNPAGLRFGGPVGGDTVRERFTVAGQQFAVVMPKESVSGPGAALPWFILAGGLLLTVLVGALGVIAARRARAQQDFDRIFNLSPDLVAVADFEGHFTRVNPAAEEILGYTEEELLTQPYLDLVHPDDRERTAAEAAAIGEGKRTLSFENRYARKDGSYRVLEWTSTPVVEERAMYSVGRDVTERRTAEAEVKRLADEQAALRRVATVVARGGSRAEVFGAIAEEVRRLFGDSLIYMFRYEDDRAVVVVASAGIGDELPIGSRQELGGNNAATHVLRTRKPVRIDDYATASGPIAEAVRPTNARSVVGTPIVVEEGLWGVMVLGTTDDDPLPPGTESRLGQFTDLMATAIANTEARAEVERLADEQAGLRRVATLVAERAPAPEMFAAVIREVHALFPGDLATLGRYESDGTMIVLAEHDSGGEVGSRWPLDGVSTAARVKQSGKPERIDNWAAQVGGSFAEVAKASGIVSSVGAPIVVGGASWGVLVIASRQAEPLPVGTELRLLAFCELVTTALSDAQARAEVTRLVDEQAALRRVATLVARGGSPAGVFSAVAGEVSTLFGADISAIVRFEDDGTVTVLGDVGGPHEAGARVRLDPGYVVHTVRETSHSARFDTDDPAAQAGALARSFGIQSSVASPIVVEGALWGAVTTASLHGPLSPAAEQRLTAFTELVATAISNTESREAMTRLAEEQAALRRVATLVAEDVPPSELFAAATEEAGKLLGADLSGMIRYNDDATVSPVAAWAAAGEHPPLPSSWSTQEGDPATMVAEAGGPLRVDRWSEVPGPMAALIRELGIRSSVGSPISVEGRLWGALAVHSQSDQPLPAGTELRLVRFTELVATAMANAEARGEVERLAQEQAALRRVATLVAEGAPPAAIFDAVAGEMAALLDADQVALNRFEPGDEILVLAHRGLDVERTPVGSTVSIEGESVTAIVRRTGRPARMEGYDEAPGVLAELARSTGLRSSVSAPIMVEGRLWGLITASWKGEQSPPPDTEQRMSRFAQLLDTAIANADARAELVASRARLVAASDEARRRFERDLHDGIQQRLVLLTLQLRGAQALAQPDDEELAEQLTQVGNGLAEALDDLRELSRGIHPAILSEGGLVPALKALARRSAVPVELDLAIAKRLDERVEIGAYYVVSEALTNTAKHARASKVEVHARAVDGVLQLKIDDDGVGGADPSRGSGLTGLVDRVEALGGTIRIKSSPGEGTSLRVELSLDGR
jgi:PAS domain S-box-containing protein